MSAVSHRKKISQWFLNNLFNLKNAQVREIICLLENMTKVMIISAALFDQKYDTNYLQSKFNGLFNK